jgi:hypothetical protein
MYENAWWDNTAKSWVDENFHVLDNVTLYDRERRKRAGGKPGKAGAKPASGRKSKKTGTEGDPLPLSSFRWNEVIFESFQSGNLKQLDLEFYLRLRLPTTKRMFRFLDKRFYKRARLDFDLRTLACEHIGMSRSYAPTELKRRLKPALEELEQLGFLEPLDSEERYSWVSRGCWRIILIRSQPSETESPPPPTEKSALADALIARGVTAKVAAELVENHPAGRLRTKLEVFDWLVKNEDKRVSKNPAGYLVSSIRADYQAPDEFSSAVKAEEIKKQAEENHHKASKKAKDEAEKLNAKEAELKDRWEKLPEAEKEAIRAAVKADNPGLGRWKNMLEPLCLAALEARDIKPKVRQKALFPTSEE